jgi:hypothetical protein
VPPPAPEPVPVPAAQAAPEPDLEPEPPRAPGASAPRIEPLDQTGRTSADVLAGPDPALTAKVAPVALFMVLLWILRRLFGSGAR